MGRSGRKRCAGVSKTPPEAAPPTSHSVPAHIALAAFRAALAADAKNHSGKDALDPCVVDYLGKITQSILRHRPQRTQLFEALGTILMGNDWDEARATETCDTIWEASQKAAARVDIQAQAIREQEAQTKALKQVREIVAEYNAREMENEEEKTELKKQRRVRRAEKRSQKARAQSARLQDDHDSDDSDDDDGSSDSDEGDLGCLSVEVPEECRTSPDHKSQGLTWIVSNVSAGKETVWSVQESAEGTLTDLKIVNRLDASPPVRPCPKRISGKSSDSSSNNKSLAYSDETTDEFKSFPMSEDTDASRRLIGSCLDSDSEACVLPEDGTRSPDATLSQDKSSPLPVLDECTSSEMDFPDTLCSALRNAAGPPRHPPRPEMDLAKYPWVAPASGRQRSKTLSDLFASTSNPSSPHPFLTHPGSVANTGFFPGGWSRQASGQSAWSRQASGQSGDWSRQVSDEQENTPFVSFKSPAQMLLWPNTPIDSPCCSFNLPPPLPPMPSLDAISGAELESAVNAAGPFQPILRPFACLDAATKASSMTSAPPPLLADMLSAINKDGEEADATDTDGPNPYQAPVFYVPVLMPCARGHCEQDVTDPDATNPPDSMRPCT